MQLKKNDRVLYAEIFKGTVMDNPYRSVGEKERYADILFDGQESIVPIQLKKLRKLNEEIKVEHKLHNLEMYKKIDLTTMLMKLAEEAMEVSIAIMKKDKENLTEELLDVMQVCIGIAYTQDINLYENIEKHNLKLLSRNHIFID